MQRESASVSLAKGVLSDNTHLAERDKSLLLEKNLSRDGLLNRPKEPSLNEPAMPPQVTAGIS